jgi:hypothetical protein
MNIEEWLRSWIGPPPEISFIGTRNIGWGGIIVIAIGLIIVFEQIRSS